MAELKILDQHPEALTPRSSNPRTHSEKQLRQIADSIRTFGFTNPILVDRDNGIIAGHGRVEAAKRLELKSVPTIRLEDMTEAEIRAGSSVAMPVARASRNRCGFNLTPSSSSVAAQIFV